jgi:hypothetical protein
MCLIGNSHPVIPEVWGWQVADKLVDSTGSFSAAFPPILSSLRRTINGTAIKLKMTGGCGTRRCGLPGSFAGMESTH